MLINLTGFIKDVMSREEWRREEEQREGDEEEEKMTGLGGDGQRGRKLKKDKRRSSDRCLDNRCEEGYSVVNPP